MTDMRPTPSQMTAIGETVVDLDAIAHNVGVLRGHAGQAGVMAVVKADGYGHGGTQVARAALAAGAAELGVATIDEAMALRHDGVTAPVLAWLHQPGVDFAPALQADIQIGVSSVRQLGEVVDAARRTGATAPITVKLDTGLNRNGVSTTECEPMFDALLRAQAAEEIRVRGLMSHMVWADDPGHPTNVLQGERFVGLLREAKTRGLRYEIAHLANSSATMSRPDLVFDMVRPGIAVYGLSPIPQNGQMGLIPAMTLRCPVALIKPVARGEGVSYGHAWAAEEDTTIALLPIGYADGVFRGLGNRIDVLINGRLRRNVGRICMDQFMVDLGPGPVDVREGDVAVLFGPGDDGEPTAQDWAEQLGTIHYEVVTSPRRKATRVYRGAVGR